MAMASSISFNSLQQNHFFFPLTLCKYNLSKLHYSSQFFVFSSSKHTLQLSPFLLLRQNFSHVASKLSTTDHEQYTETRNPRTSKETSSGFPPLRSTDEKMGNNSGKKYFSSVVEQQDENRFTKGKNTRENLGFRKKKEMGDGNLSVKSKDKKVVKSWRSTDKLVVDERRNKKPKDGRGEKGEEEKKEKGSKKSKVDSPEVQLRVGLDMCSKRGDVMSAIQFYDLAQREGIRLGQYHYTVLLYLCSSAAVGVVRPAKSGSGSRTLNALESSNDSRLDDVDDTFNEKEKLNWFSNGFVKKNSRLLDGLSHPKKGDDESSQVKDGSENQEDRKICVDEEMKKYALQRGFEIYEKMCMDKIPMNEAALTSVARMAISMGNGDMAFDMVKQMKTMGINPRLRSYGPALSAFCNIGDIDKAFAVEKHMLEHGVYPEEPELEALLRVSVGSGKGDKVYYLLHKLRTTVRKVSPSVADLIASWFDSKAASRVGKTKWDERVIKEAVLNGGGGWHGQGWLGRGKWSVLRTTIGGDGLCQCCGEKLATIDLDPTETENFAESVASIAIKREKHSNFQKFQKWLDYYGPFEAVVDAANVGLFSQKRFQPSKVSAIVNGIRQKLPTKKWPLIILHNKRVMGPKMDEPVNKALLDKWRNADALYATPTGSNDDWYWLYAAIKFKCLLVTNDEMRDHTFQLLGNDFFPKWKERHQVRFNFSDAGPVFHMPPPCSVVIQESEKGHWHIPIMSENDYEVERSWLCVMREKYRVTRQISETRPADLQRHHHDKRIARSAIQTEVKSEPYNNSKHKDTTPHPQEIYKNLKDILSETMNSNRSSWLQQIESAEKQGGCTIDFQI